MGQVVMKEFHNDGHGMMQMETAKEKEDIWSRLEAPRRKQLSVIFSHILTHNMRYGLVYMIKDMRKLSHGPQVKFCGFLRNPNLFGALKEMLVDWITTWFGRS